MTTLTNVGHQATRIILASESNAVSVSPAVTLVLTV